MIDDLEAFIHANTVLLPAPHAPEIRLHVAAEITPLWSLTEAALGELGLAPPFWAFPWAGGQAIARFLLDRPQEARGKAALDLASGSGLCAIAAMKAGACSALAADIDPLCRAAVAMNARANGVVVQSVIADLLPQPPPAIDLILAGDICYEKSLAQRVLNWLGAAHRNGSRVLIGDPGRAYFPREGLIRLADYQVRTSLDLEDAEVKRTGVWTFAAAQV